MKLMPTKIQWDSWNFLEKLGVVSAYTSFVGFVLSIIFFIYPMLASEDAKKNKYIQEGVDQAINSYQELGMVGIQASVEDCYQKINKKSDFDDVLLCLSVDTVGVLIELGAIEIFEVSTNQFSTEDMLIRRAIEASKKTGSELFFKKKLIQNVWLPQIASQYYETMDEKY